MSRQGTTDPEALKQNVAGVILQLPSLRRPSTSRFVRPMSSRFATGPASASTVVMRSNFLPGRASRPLSSRQPGLPHALVAARFAFKGRLPQPANDWFDPSSVFASKFLMPPRRIGGAAAGLWQLRRYCRAIYKAVKNFCSGYC